MNLKPMSLEETTEKAQPPRLEFEEHNIVITLTLHYLYYTIQAVISSKDEPENFSNCLHGNAKHSFKNVIQNYETSDINDVLILGSLCEALCKTGVSINLLIQNESLIDKFVKEALLYCNCSLKDYQFSLTRAIHLLTVKTTNCYFRNTKVFLLLKQRDKYSVFCTALLHIHRKYVAVVYKTLGQKFIEIPESIASSNLETETLNHIYDAIIWVLLNASGFYLDKNNSFHNAKSTHEQEIKMNLFYFFSVFNPIQINPLF